MQCLEVNGDIDMENLEMKLKHNNNYYYGNNVFSSNLFNEGGHINLDSEKDRLWSTNLHPKYGYCHTFHLSNVDEFRYLTEHVLEFRFIQVMVAFLHERNDLSDESNAHIFSVGEGTNSFYEATLEKRILSRTSLQRSPCSSLHYLTCRDVDIHYKMAMQYNCTAPILYSGKHLDSVVNGNQSLCNNSVILKVIHTLLQSLVDH